MATYLKAPAITIKRQEGDTPDLEMEITGIDISTFDIYFAVFRKNGEQLIEKKLTDWVKDGQFITAHFSEADTKGKAGRHDWEMEIVNESTIITICGGNFIIDGQLIKTSRHT